MPCDVIARIVDLDVFERNVAHNPAGAKVTSDTIINIGNLVPGYGCIVRPEHIPLGAGDSRRFNIFFYAKNGSFTQLLRYRKVQDNWLQALKVMSNGPAFEQFEPVHEEYPRDSNGQVNWDASNF